MRPLLVSLALSVSLIALNFTAAEPPQAKPGAEAAPVKEYKVRLRFQIDAARRQRADQYKAMLKELERTGFKKDPGLEREEFFSDYISGTVPAAGAAGLLREGHVRTVLLVPSDYQMPAGEAPVLVQVSLSTRFSPGRQKEVWDKSRGLLKALGLQEAVGYDHRSFTRTLGWLPAQTLQLGPKLEPPAVISDEATIDMAVAQVPQRGQEPTGPATVRFPSVQRVEVLREPMDAAGPTKEPEAPMPVPAEQPHLEKVSPELRAKLAELGDDDSKKQELARVEVVLRWTPAADDDAWRRLLLARPMVIEGRVGPVVTGLIPLGQIAELASSLEVSTVRLPQWDRPLVLPPLDAKNSGQLPLDYVLLGREPAEPRDLAALVRRRQPQRSAVVASDFRGYEKHLGSLLPAKTHVVDLTAERNPDLQPDKQPGDANEVGPGTRIALALHAAAPADELFLVRIAPAAAYQVGELAEIIHKGNWRSELLARREGEIRDERDRLQEQATELRIERKLVMDNFSEDELSRQARKEYLERQQKFDQAEKIHRQKAQRFTNLIKQAGQLRDVTTIVIGLTWTDGHPALEPGGILMRHLDNAARSAAWAQIVPQEQEQVWSGLFADADQDGAMEFGPADPSARKQADLKFLAWKPHSWEQGAKETVQPDLPAKGLVQLTVQWRDVHTPEWSQDAKDDVYRRPIFSPQIVVLRQRDPAGRVLPTDLFEVVARSSGLPDRLENHPRYAVYQATVRFQVPDQPGRYAVRLEAKTPDSTLPPEAARLPRREQWEVYPTLRVELLDPPELRGRGRVVLEGR